MSITASGEKVPAESRSKVEKAIAEVKEALKGTDILAIKAAVEKLNEVWQSASEVLAQAGGEKGQPAHGKAEPERAPSGHERGQNDEGPIIDAEVVDEKKA